MDVAALTVMKEGIFRPKRIEIAASDLDLSKLDNFTLCAKSCDGTYHEINNRLRALLIEKKHILSNGGVAELANELSPNEDIHGQRFIVFRKNTKEAFLLGDTHSALRKLAQKLN